MSETETVTMTSVFKFQLSKNNNGKENTMVYYFFLNVYS